MNQPNVGFEADLRMSTRPVNLSLLLVGIIIFILSFYRSEFSRAIAEASFGAAIVCGALIAWRIDEKEQVFGRLLTVMLPILVMWISILGFGFSSASVFAFLPVAIAAALIGIPTAVGAAAIQSGLIVGASRLDAELGLSTYHILAVWSMVGVMVLVYRPVLSVGRWTWEFFKSAQNMLEEARNRKAELEQAMQDLLEANRQLFRLNKLAQNLRLDAENLRQAKEQFVANVSHELRTPINMIIGYTEMILQKPTMYGKKIPGGLMADLAVIERNAEQLSHLINDILDLSQVESGQMPIIKETVVFEDIINFSAAAVQPLFKAKGLYLDKEISGDSIEVNCDPVRMQEVLLNLLSNAARFTEKGGVQIKAWTEGAYLHVSVSDTGPGIDQENLGRLFVPFEQLDNAIRKKYGGTGLGLAISKRLVELHNGNIWVKSTKGEGTTFTFNIPKGVEKRTAANPARWINPYMPYEKRLHLPRLPETKDRGAFVVMETGASLGRILSRYVGDFEMISAADLADANLKLAQTSAAALLMNDQSTRDGLEVFIDAARMLETGTPLIAFSLPGIAETRSKLNVADVLTKPISRSQLLGSLKSIGILEGTILVADDDPDALQLFGRILTTSDPPYRVRLARDGQETLDLLREFRPDAILLDLAMPKISGYQLLKERDIRPELHDIPIIIISAQDIAKNPLVSDLMVVTQKDGLSIHQLLACIKAISQTLSPGFRGDVPGPQEDPLD